MPYDLKPLPKPKEDDQDRLTQVNFQLTRHQNWLLTRIALKEGLSKSELARQIFKRYLEKDYPNINRPWKKGK